MSVGSCALPAQREFGQIPIGRKSCGGGWISGPFPGFKNVSHVTMKTSKQKTRYSHCCAEDKISCVLFPAFITAFMMLAV